MTIHSPEPAAVAAPAGARERLLRYAFMKLTRDFDSRFEALLLTGRVSKWYSEVGNEATTIPAGLALGPGDALCTLHRDLGAILAVYLDPARAFPGFGFGEPDGRRPDPDQLLQRLACQLLGKGEGFSQGVERSFHYGYLAPEHGILHVGMISHLGSMIPVAAGCAFAFRQSGSDRVAINFIGEGGTSTGDFHEGLNMAAVWKLPLILVIENNRYAFSTPARLQYAAARLSDRGAGYGIAAETVDGNDPDAMADAPPPAAERGPSGETTYVDAINQALREEMERDESVVLMGQDIGVFEGAFRTTRGLHDRWPERVLDTPIAESGTIGIAIGAALLGYRPVVEMQFGDFISCGFNQLVNVAAKLYYRWQVPCPIVVRLPTGGGVGAGPFHSQNPEGWFAHTAGIKVVCPATAADARGLLKAAIRDPNPVMLFEHKYLYRRIKSELPEGDPVARIGEARVMRSGKHLTLIGYGASTWTCLEVADELAKSGVEA